MAAKYRILVPRFWTDPLTQDLNDRQRSIFFYCVTGPLASVVHHCTGIYELYRGTFQNTPFGYSLDEIDEVMNFFNEKKSKLLQYDATRHMVFVPSLFKHNGTYKKGLEPVMKSFDETFHKAPEFWLQFVDKYYLQLLKMAETHWKTPPKPDLKKSDEFNKQKVLDFEEETKKELEFLNTLKNLRNEINQLPPKNPKPEISAKLLEKEEEKNI